MLLGSPAYEIWGGGGAEILFCCFRADFAPTNSCSSCLQVADFRADLSLLGEDRYGSLHPCSWICSEERCGHHV
ncbi:hypothetical protein BRADI_5g02796v3 [Brachypodium distachyon]|uniref:Uncharacterized protein n=1 Tax=Brachypodium distachyon TaxID=15368 RepID=A0A0Q3E6B4_BRADI|nr:hypothetical protein BRADI_5g02796v3 [Brachypodium distachyon]